MSKGTSLSKTAEKWPHEDAGKTEHRVFACIGDMLAYHGRHSPERPAILSPEGAALTYSAFWARTNEIVRELRDFGVGRNDRVAVVLPTGPEAAVATIAVAAPQRGPRRIQPRLLGGATRWRWRVRDRRR